MKKNLLDKMISRHRKDNHNKTGTWLYAGYEIVGYVTADDELLNLRPEVENYDR